MKNLFAHTVALCSLVLISACSNDESSATYVAALGDLKVSSQELEYQKSKILGLNAATADVEKRIIESIILTKLMSVEQKKSMSVNELSQHNVRMKAYEEEMLAKDFISQNASVNPPTNQEIADFYNKYPEKFGGGTKYEITTWKLEPNCELKKSKLDSGKNLDRYIDGLDCEKTKKTNFVNENQVSELVARSKNKLEVGKVYLATKSTGTLAVKLNSKQILKPKPLSEVASDIRKMLSPLKLKAAIKSLKAELIKDMEVEFLD